MKNLSILPLMFVLIYALSASAQMNHSTAHTVATTQHAGGEKKITTESPFACMMDALSPAEKKRHFDELSPMLRGLRTGVRELKDGYEFQYPSDRKTFDLVSEWAIQEQLCCPFFDISIRLEREGGPLWLRLTGRKGTKEFISDDFAKWLNKE